MMQSRPVARIITREVIKGLGLAGAAVGVLVAPNAAQLIGKIMKGADKRSAHKTLSYLKYRKLVEVRPGKEGYEYRLTAKGVDKFRRLSLDDMAIKTPPSWDGKWRLVMFDIPVTRHAARHLLLQSLKRMQFYMIQNSAWIHPFDCELEIGALLQAYQLEKFVSFLIVESGNFSDHAIEYYKKIGLLI